MWQFNFEKELENPKGNKLEIVQLLLWMVTKLDVEMVTRVYGSRNRV